MRTSAALLVLSVGSLALFSTEARTSGSFTGSFLSPSFEYTYAESARHWFEDGDSSDAYYDRYEREVKVDFLGIQPNAENAIVAARKAGMAIGPFDLFLPSLRVKDADVERIEKAAFPLNIVLDVASGESAKERFMVTATGPWTKAQLTSLRAALKKVAAVKGKHNQMSDAKDAADKKRVDEAGFTVPPLAATHVDELFGLYVGTTSFVMAPDRARVVALLQARLDKMLQSLRARFAAADAHTQLNVTALAPVKPHVAAHPQGLPGAFHPYGPLGGTDLVRLRVDIGQVAAILMISPPAKYEWPKVHPVLHHWLDEAIADPHLALVEDEAERLDPEN